MFDPDQRMAATNDRVYHTRPTTIQIRSKTPSTPACDVAVRPISHSDDQAVGLAQYRSRAPTRHPALILCNLIQTRCRRKSAEQELGKIQFRDETHVKKAPAHRSRVVEEHSTIPLTNESRTIGLSESG